MKNIIKVLSALATVAGVIYIIATYGEQIVAWAKKVWSSMPQCPACKEEEEDEVVAEVSAEPEAEEAVAEEPEAEEAVAEEPAAEEVAVEEIAEEPAPEVVVAENEPVAEESDFAE